MSKNLKIVIVDSKYCDYLRTFDSRVPYNKEKKDFRPFVGVLFTINGVEFFAPLSSPKEKHLKMKNTIDFTKIANGELGAINFNNMIPVGEKNYQVIDMHRYDPKIFHDKKYYEMQKKELLWINHHKYMLVSKAIRIYNYYINDCLPINIKERCCNYKLLEEKCLEYNEKITNNTFSYN